MFFWSKKLPMEAEQRRRTIKKVTVTGAIINCLLAASQILFGIIGHSQALLADGFHTLSDLLSDFIVLFAVKQSSQKADAEHPYGHGRIETLATVALGLLLLLAGLGIGYRGFLSIISNEQAKPELITLFFAFLAIGSKEFLYRYTLKAARQTHSSMLESNAWHHRSDALSSIVVVVGISTQIIGVPYMDAAAAIIVAIMIVLMGFRLTQAAFKELIDTSLDSDLVDEVKTLIEAHDCVQEVHSLRSRSMGGQGYLDAEVRVTGWLTVSEAHYVAFSLEQQIITSFPRIVDVSIHVDPLTESGHDSVSGLPLRTEVLEMLNQAWQKISCGKSIESIHLHYLQSQIEIDIVLPETMASDSYRDEIAQMVAATDSIDAIGKVNVYFLRPV
jgi:cation diffusion facilitator family transporter